jgi:hypothetical protein
MPIRLLRSAASAVPTVRSGRAARSREPLIALAHWRAPQRNLRPRVHPARGRRGRSLVERSPVSYLDGIDNLPVNKTVIFRRCNRCHQIVAAGLCFCIGLSATQGAKLPPSHAMGAVFSTAIGGTGTATTSGHSLVVHDQVTGKTYTALRKDEKRRIARYDDAMKADAALASNVKMGPTGRVIGFDATKADFRPRLTGPTGPTRTG